MASATSGEAPAEAAPPRLDGQRRRWLRAAVVLGAVGLLALLLRRLELVAVGAALARARWGPIAIAAALNLVVSMPLCGLRWGLLLSPVTPSGAVASRGYLLGLYFARCALNLLLLPPAGDVLFTLRLRARGYPTVTVVALQLLETVLELLSMGLLAALLLLLRPPAALAPPLYVIAALAAAGATLLWVIAPWLRDRPRPVAEPVTRRGRALLLLARLTDALFLARRLVAPSLAISLLHQLATVTMIGLCLTAVSIDLHAGAWFLLFLAATFAGLLPSTPAQLGVLEAGLVIALGVLGVPAGDALAFALLYHAANVVPVALVGLFALQRVSANHAR